MVQTTLDCVPRVRPYIRFDVCLYCGFNCLLLFMVDDEFAIGAIDFGNAGIKWIHKGENKNKEEREKNTIDTEFDLKLCSCLSCTHINRYTHIHTLSSIQFHLFFVESQCKHLKMHRE